MKKLFRLLMLAGAACTVDAQAEDRLQNWFNDPFFQISSFIPDCPLPAGPFVDQSERNAQAHHRAEKGSSCWLAGECERPSAYAYDHQIASAFQAAVREHNAFPDTSLWATVQGRVVYVEGCVARRSSVAEIEALTKSLPQVQQVLVTVRTDPAARPPYRLRVPD
jgi:hypothetical protein